MRGLSVGTVAWLLLAGLSLPVQQVAGEEATTAAVTPPAPDYSRALQAWFGDYRGMVERRMVRIAVPYSMTHYFLDGASERGVSAAMGRQLESAINREEQLRSRLVHVVFIPAPRRNLLHYVTAGMADIAMGGLVESDETGPGVEYSIPFKRNSEAVLVTGPTGYDAKTMADLAGQTVYVQEPGDYLEPLQAASRSIEQNGGQPIQIAVVDADLEPDELLELVQSGQLPATVVDNHLAEFWSEVFTELRVHSGIEVGPPRNIAWAFRADSPELEQVLNDFLRENRQRTEFGNIMLRRYLRNVRFVSDPMASRDRQRFEQTSG